MAMPILFVPELKLFSRRISRRVRYQKDQLIQKINLLGEYQQDGFISNNTDKIAFINRISKTKKYIHPISVEGFCKLAAFSQSYALFSYTAS